jgi:GNAT superfamily N-acetyltransferase
MAGEGEVITTYLQMAERPSLQVTPPHRAGMLLRIGEPAVAFYRYVARQMGGAAEDVDDDALAERLVDDAYDVYVLYLGGVPAAMFELDRRTPEEVEMVAFGVLDGFGGRGLGKYVLASAVDAAWKHGPERIWVTSTNHDDPRRILLLQWAGFTPYRTERERRG